MNELISQHLDIWTTAIASKSNAGRGNKSSSPAHPIRHKGEGRGEGNPNATRNAKYTAYGIKKLRELILELAVRGRLVPQDPNDGPASVLLEIIAKEKVRLTKDRILKTEKDISVIADKDKPYKIPEKWEWVRLVDIYYSISPSGKKLKTSEISESGDYPVVDQGQSHIAGYTNDVELLIEIPGPVVIFGDHTTELKYIDFNFVAGADGTKILRPYSMDERYFFTYLKSYKLENRGYARHFKVLNANLMALPPLAEQHRIVAKVDELMGLCDQLEQQQTDSIAAHQTLVQTLLETLTQAADAAEFEQAWSRIAEHFDTLFTTEPSIDQLKQTLLQLAVMGKLVPQDQNDQAADILLKRGIDKEKNGQSLLSPIIPSEQQIFTLPAGWYWTRGELVADFIDPHPSHRTPPEYENGVPYIGYTDIDHINGINFSNARRVNPTILNEHQERYILKKGDFVFGKIGTLGKPFFLPEPFDYCLSANLILIQPNLMVVNPKYLAMYLDSPVFITVMADNTTNSTHGVFGIKKARLICVPLPPIEEQHRIVAKVDELMTLCDALKARIAAAQTTQLQLADAIVEQAVA